MAAFGEDLESQRTGCNDHRTGDSVETLRRAIMDNLYYREARLPATATRNDWYLALAYTVRDRIISRWIKTIEAIVREDMRVVSYFSAEFLMGPQLVNNMINLGIYEEMRQAATELGLDFDALIGQEEEPGLGNGGLGRLAACFMDSLATLEIRAVGYGVRYEYGLFDQAVRDGWQVEMTDKWLRLGNPWEIERPEIAYEVNLGGHTESYHDREGRYRVRWVPHQVVKGVAYDTPILGYGVPSVNLLRLWSAQAVESFDFQAFNVGDYYGAVDEKMASETISKVLYPNDEPATGKVLRLAQQYFFVSCSLQDLIRFQLLSGNKLDTFHEWNAIQLNDTHPSIAVAELMRLLVDEHFMEWDEAWHITRNTFAYTNHTLLPEALEKWPLPLFRQVLPRHLEIIYEINHRFLEEVRQKVPDDGERAARLSIIDERGEKFVRMAHLASVGSYAINGVAGLHSDLVRKTILRDFYEYWPEKFHNVTNGVTPRRWMVLSNPRQTELITGKIGDRWISHLEDNLNELESYAENGEFRRRWQGVKRENKRHLASIIRERTGVVVNPDTLFDIQVKRIHEYKRQHLNVLHVVTLFNRLKQDPNLVITPRTVIFGGKSAPGYFMAKLIIKLINSVAEVVNSDGDVAGRLKVVFFPDFNVKNAHHIYPAADLSEQISTAGKEASGTGNMKFSMNGALTIGTLDGANVEIREEVGAENFFLFGMTAEEVNDVKVRGYHPRGCYEANADLRDAIDLIGSGFFSAGDPNLFKPLVDSLLNHDEYMLLADYPSYMECQQRVSDAYGDQEKWTRMSILNVSRMGKFSSDRSIREYSEKIWRVEPVPVSLDEGEEAV
ncbi:MAG: glycogen/starch/alpha-glucan phosphorylase [Deltaproteobacteria bacterium]|nr:glycogen/starch/alpha-glucan phosphorylase [Deltaproteobacteria bacterium]